MENKNKLTCAQAKNMDMIAYLSGLGHEPARIRNVNYWYLSPLRNERTPSFKVNKRLNRWYDHGIGKGGNFIDFGIRYHQCSVAELLQILSGDFSFQKQNIASPNQPDEEHKIIIDRETSLAAPALLQYLQKRKISLAVAERYCREIHYRVGDKMYFAIGLKNDSGGYELRNLYFKGSSAPKDITTIQNGHFNVVVFEGMFDFLAYQTWYEPLFAIRRANGVKGCDYVILNSIAFFEKARPFLEQHQSRFLLLDRDAAGQNCSACARALSKDYKDDSYQYKGYKDFSQWFEFVGYRKM